MSAYGSDLVPSYNEVTARREWELGVIKEKLSKNEVVDLPLCKLERVSATESTVHFGLKRGKLVYVFKYNTLDVERDKHRNVITRARFIKHQLELAGYRLIPWDFKKGQPPRFWDQETETMDEEDDDLYGPSETAAPTEQKSEEVKNGDESEGDEPMQEGSSGEDESDSDDSDDVEFIIDRPPEASKPVQPPKPVESKAIKIEPPPQLASTSQQAPRGIVPQLQGQPGTAYPAQKTSSIDVNAEPTYPPLGKSILQVDIDADLAEASKPWRLPGADQSDYFNYGFDEFTWEMYRQRQTTMAGTLTEQKAETAQLQSMFGPGMGPGMPAMGGGNQGATGPPSAPAGPAAGAGGAPPGGPMGGMMNEEMIQQAMAQMMQSGIDPSQMDFQAFMQMAGGGGGMGGGGGFPDQQQQQQQQGGYGVGGGGGGGGRGGRRGGRGRGGW